jgi:hypothetical protein
VTSQTSVRDPWPGPLDVGSREHRIEHRRPNLAICVTHHR